MKVRRRHIHRDGILGLIKNHVLGTTIGVIFGRLMTSITNKDTLDAIKNGKLKESDFVAETKSRMTEQLKRKLNSVKQDTKNPLRNDDIKDLNKTISAVQGCRTVSDISSVFPDDNRLRLISEAFKNAKIRQFAKKDTSPAIIKHKRLYKKWRDDAVQEVTQEKSKLITMLTNFKNSLVRFFNIPIVKKVIHILGIIIKILVTSVALATLYAKFKHSFGDNKTKQTFSEFLETDAVPKPIRLFAKAGFAACVSFTRLLGKFVKLENVEKKVEEVKALPDKTNNTPAPSAEPKHRIFSIKKSEIKRVSLPNKKVSKIGGIIKSKNGSGFSMIASDLPFNKKQMKSGISYNIIKTDSKRLRIDGVHKVNDDVMQNLKESTNKAKSGLTKFANSFPSIAKALRIILKLSGWIDVAVGGISSTSMLASSLNNLQHISNEAEREGAGFVFKMYVYPIIVLLSGIVKLKAARALTPDKPILV